MQLVGLPNQQHGEQRKEQLEATMAAPLGEACGSEVLLGSHVNISATWRESQYSGCDKNATTVTAYTALSDRTYHIQQGVRG